MVEVVRAQLNKSTTEMKKIKENNRQNILENHTYACRVQDLLTL